jgi:hypothetical protein
MHGYCFCKACAEAVSLMLRNALRVVAINWVGDFALFLGRIVVAGIVTAAAVIIFPIWNEDVQCIVVPAVIAFVCSWMAAGAFTSVFEMGIDAMFVCFLEDEERNENRTKKAPQEMLDYVDGNDK